MYGIGLYRALLGDGAQAERANYGIPRERSAYNSLALAVLAFGLSPGLHR